MKFNAALGEKWVIHSHNIWMPLRWSYEFLIHLKAKSIELLRSCFLLFHLNPKGMPLLRSYDLLIHLKVICMALLWS